MTLNYVTLTLDLYDGQGNPVIAGEALFTPTAQLTDTTNHELITQAAVPAVFHSAGTPAVRLLATDNGPPAPAGWAWTVTFSGVPGSPAAFSFYLPYTSGASQNLSAQAPVATPSALLGSTAAGVSVYPSGDTSGATDQANITAAEALGLTVYLAPGTFWVTGLIKQSGTLWKGAGRAATTIKLASGANTDVIQGANFSTLTLGGTTGGITDWGIRDLTVDGNKANQSGTSYGIRVYGYNFDLADLSVQSCRDWGMYTEWAANSGGVTDGMESRYRGLKIHDNSGGGWHDRGPHDARSWDVTIWANSATQAGYWAETSLATTVAAGSNGADLSTFTSGSPGTLSTGVTLGYPTASISATQGAITVATAMGNVTLTYTGTTALSFTGCVAQGSPASGSTVSTGGAINYVGGFTANGQLHTQMHVYANPMWDFLLDCQVHLLGCVGEVTRAGGACVLLRYGNCQITGGLYVIYTGTTQLGAGIQIGDTVNPAGSNRIDTALYGFAGTSAATAALNIVNTGSNNSIDLVVYQTSGQAVFGSPQRDRVRVFTSGSGVYATDASNSQHRQYGAGTWFLPSASQAWRLSNSSGDYLNLNASSNRSEHVGGILDRWYSDQYSTTTAEISGASGFVRPGTSAGAGGRIYSGSGAPNISAAVAGDVYFRTDVGNGRTVYSATGNNTWSTLQIGDLPAVLATGFSLLATAGGSGVALGASGSTNLLTWAAPSDGAIHRVIVLTYLVVATNLTGGKIDLSFVGPDNVSHTPQVYAANLTTSFTPGTLQSATQLVKAGSTVAVFQESGVSGGAATLYAEIWGS